MNTATAQQPSTRQMRRQYEDQAAANPGQHDSTDFAYWMLQDTQGRSWTPSELARVFGWSTTEAAAILRGLVADGMITATDRGAWTRYSI